MYDGYQYTLPKEIQIRMCDSRDPEGFCLKSDLHSKTDEFYIPERPSCESLLRDGSCPL